MVGVRPRLEIIRFERPDVWAERGRWHGIEATLVLAFERTPPRLSRRRRGRDLRRAACTPHPRRVAGRLAGPAIRADLRKAARLLSVEPAR